MKFSTLNGRIINRSYSDYLIDWDKKSLSKIQFKVKQFLKPYWKNHVCYEEFPLPACLLRVDFLNATLKLAVRDLNYSLTGSFKGLSNAFSSRFNPR